MSTDIYPALKRAQDRRRRAQRRLNIAVVVMLAALTVAVWILYSQRDDARDTVADLRSKVSITSEQAGNNAAAAELLAEQVQRLGQQPVVDPSTLPTPPSNRRPAGLDRDEVLRIVDGRLSELPPPPTPQASVEQVTDVVTDVLAENPPEPGRPPTADEVRAVVEAYFEDNPVQDGQDCDPDVNPDCRGPGPTDEQIDAAVARFCADGACRGEPGAPAPAPSPCPGGFEPRETGPVTDTDGTTYERSTTCVDPASARTAEPQPPPSEEPPG